MPPFRKVAGLVTIQAIRRTLRVALNWAITQQILTFNPAKCVELTKAPRARPLLWTDARVKQWRATGKVPGAVMVWTPEQFDEFLNEAEADDELHYSIFHLMGHRRLAAG